MVGPPPPAGPGVHDDGHDGLHQGELGAQAQGQQHDEEEEGPHLGAGEEGHRLRVHDEGKAGAVGGDLTHKWPTSCFMKIRFFLIYCVNLLLFCSHWYLFSPLIFLAIYHKITFTANLFANYKFPLNKDIGNK